MHPTISLNAFFVVLCKQLGPDEYYLLADLTQKCFTPSYFYYVFLVGLPSFIVYVVGIPYLFYFVLRKYYQNPNYSFIMPNISLLPGDFGKKLQLEEVRVVTSFMQSGYKRDYYYWEVVNMIHKVFIAMIMAVFSSFTEVQLTFGVMISAVFVVLLLRSNPFIDKEFNLYQFFGISVSLVIFYCSYLIYIPDTTDTQKVGFGVIMAIFMLLFAIFTIGFLFFNLKKNYDRKDKLSSLKNTGDFINESDLEDFFDVSALIYVESDAYKREVAFKNSQRVSLTVNDSSALLNSGLNSNFISSPSSVPENIFDTTSKFQPAPITPRNQLVSKIGLATPRSSVSKDDNYIAEDFLLKSIRLRPELAIEAGIELSQFEPQATLTNQKSLPSIHIEMKLKDIDMETLRDNDNKFEFYMELIDGLSSLLEFSPKCMDVVDLQSDPNDHNNVALTIILNAQSDSLSALDVLNLIDEYINKPEQLKDPYSLLSTIINTRRLN